MDSHGNKTMSLRPNLESLTEVTEKYYTDARNPPLNVNQQIPNAEKFDSLIDNVLTSFSEVQLSVQELMQLKDDILMYYLPPPLLFRMAVVFGKVFRSFSDLNTPVNEMLRLVKIFSASWEKNAAILKKLNDMYENKKQLLNIAIKRLSAVEKKTKLFTREKRIQNWEKLFIKLSEAKGHGRRWKFQIETFRKKANLGYEELMNWLTNEEANQNEIQNLDEMNDETSNKKIIDRKNMKAASKKRGSHFNSDFNLDNDDFDFNKHDNSIDEIDSDKDLFSDEEEETNKKTDEKNSNKEVIDVNIQTEPFVEHQSTWTGEPNYKRYIIVRVFKPSEYMLKKLKFKIKFQNQMLTSNAFDPPKVDSKSSKKPTETTKDKKKVKAKPNADLQNDLDEIKEEESNSTTEKNKIIVTKYQDFMFEMSDFIQKNTTTLSTEINTTDKCIYIEMNSDDKDHIGGYSHIQLDDINTLDLPILYYKANEEAQVIDYYDKMNQDNQINKKEDIKMDFSNCLKLNELTTESADMYTMLSKRTPFSFDMFAMNKAKSGNSPICKLPLMFFWIRQSSSLTKDKNTGTISINDLLNEMALINNLVPKKQEDQAVPLTQPILQAPVSQKLEQKMVEKFDKMCSPIKDLVSRPSSSRVDSAVKSNNDLEEAQNAEIEIIKENYEMNIEQLKLRIMNLENELNTLRSLHELNLENQQNNFKLRSKISKNSISTTETKDSLKPAQKLSNKQNQIYTRDIPQDFFDRLKLFNERSTVHHKEIIEKYLREEASIREQQMAVQHRLDQNRNDNQNSRLEDFCLPAVFMPFRSSNNVFNPRAHQYFHALGSNDPRLTQPPSVFQLPPLPSKTSLSVINLFEMGKRYQAGGVDFGLNNNQNSKLLQTGDKNNISENNNDNTNNLNSDENN